MKVNVLKLGKVLFSDEAEKVVLPGVLGEMCLMPHHISIVTLMREGMVKIFASENAAPTEIQISGGVCSLSNGVASLVLYGE